MKRLAISVAVTLIALCSPLLGTSATEFNNGTKLILKEGTDSLFYTHNYYGVVECAYSEGGASWSENMVDAAHDYPALAADSTSRRWIVTRWPVLFPGFPERQHAYYRSGSEWIGPQIIYSNPDKLELGPAGLDGAAFTTTSWAYAVFCVTDEEDSAQYIVLTKFNGSSVAACTLATDNNLGLGDPAIAVEPYKADSNRIHMAWEDNGSITYAVGLDCRTSSSIGSLATTSIGSGTHPSINADRGRVVAAWTAWTFWTEEDSGLDIYARQRLSAIWDDAVNLSNSYATSDWATIALGDTTAGVDTLVVAWEEAISANDHDIYACINLDPNDVRNIANNATYSSFPHITLQDAGEELYLHTIWSEANYVVDYDKTDLRDGRREGQQSAGSSLMSGGATLAACEPNPFHGHTQISYALPAAGNVSLGVYDATGRPVRTLASGHQTAGNYTVSWDAHDADGRQVPYGVYFYRLDTPGFRSVQKAVLTK